MKEFASEYGVAGDRAVHELFLNGINFDLDGVQLQEHVEYAVAMVVLRLLPDVLEGTVRVENGDRFVRLMQKVVGTNAGKRVVEGQ